MSSNTRKMGSVGARPPVHTCRPDFQKNNGLGEPEFQPRSTLGELSGLVSGEPGSARGLPHLKACPTLPACLGVSPFFEVLLCVGGFI